MRFLADENVPRSVIEALRSADHAVASVAEDEPGAPDDRLIARSKHERRILLTFDKDFGRCVFSGGHAPPPGIVLVSIAGPSPTILARRILEALERAELRGMFTVIEENNIRQRVLRTRRKRPT